MSTKEILIARDVATVESIKVELHELIRQSDMLALKAKIDQLQGSLLHFDDPSLLLLSIEVYLDPKCLFNQQHQKEIIVILIKAGLRLWSPKGEIFLYLMNKCQSFQSDDMNLTEEELEQKLIEVTDTLLDSGLTGILLEKVPSMVQSGYENFSDFFHRHQSALKIQSWWRSQLARQEVQKLKEEQIAFRLE